MAVRFKHFVTEKELIDFVAALKELNIASPKEIADFKNWINEVDSNNPKNEAILNNALKLLNTIRIKAEEERITVNDTPDQILDSIEEKKNQIDALSKKNRKINMLKFIAEVAAFIVIALIDVALIALATFGCTITLPVVIGIPCFLAFSAAFSTLMLLSLKEIQDTINTKFYVLMHDNNVKIKELNQEVKQQNVLLHSLQKNTELNQKYDSIIDKIDLQIVEFIDDLQAFENPKAEEAGTPKVVPGLLKAGLFKTDESSPTAEVTEKLEQSPII
ncbi:MAG: hypothetical protein WC627_06355 [Legionella sp.]|jgi:hypothetical protein